MENTTENPLVITISREYGSGGHKIGEKSAQALGVEFYDNIKMDKSVTDFGPGALLDARRKFIREKAAEKSCVFVSALADSELEKRPNTLRVFIRAPKWFRKKRVKKYTQVSTPIAEKEMFRIDNLRRSQCREYSGRMWGSPEDYDLYIDSSVLGIATTAKKIVKAARAIGAPVVK